VSNNYNDGVETFIIRVKKSDGDDIKNIDSGSLITSLLQKGSFFKVEEVLKTTKKER